MSTEEKLDLILVELCELRAIVKPPVNEPALTLQEAMQLTKHKSTAVFYRFVRSQKVQPYSRGRYRRDDILSAMARGALTRRKVA